MVIGVIDRAGVGLRGYPYRTGRNILQVLCAGKNILSKLSAVSHTLVLYLGFALNFGGGDKITCSTLEKAQ